MYDLRENKEFKMKKIWKWILGIAIVLVVLAGLAGLVFVMRNNIITANFHPGYGFQPRPGWNEQSRGWREPAMHGGDPMLGERFSRFGRLPFGFLFGGLMQLIPLALLALVFYGVYRIGKNSAKPAAMAAASPAAATHACANCGTAVQDGSKFCPNCGEKQ